MIKYILSDNLQAMAQMKDGEYDLAPVDPEYGIGESSKNHLSRNTPVKQRNGSLLKAPDNTFVKSDWDNQVPPAKYFKELFRVSKNQLIFGANYFTEIVGSTFKPVRRPEFKDFISDNTKGWIIWDKVNGLNDFNDCEMIWTSFNRPSFILPYMWNGMMQGKSIREPYTMQGNKKLNEKRIHPTQKPLIIYHHLYERYATINSKILDTHLGSGSSGIAAQRFGIKDFLGIENNVGIFSDALLRLNNHLQKQKFQLL